MEKKLDELLKTRVERFRERVGKAVLGPQHPLTVKYRHCPKPVPFEDRVDGYYETIAIGKTWGAKWESAWFHITGEIPRDWEGKHVVARIDVGGEGLVYNHEGEALQGLSNGSIFQHDFNRDLLPLNPRCKGGEPVELWVEGASNGLFGLFSEPDPEVDHPNRFGSYNAQLNAVELRIFHEEVWHLWLDLRILAGFLLRLPEKSVRRARIMHNLNRAMDACRRLPEDASHCREILASELEKPANASDPTVIAVGHAHIDTAWLWPVAETVRKCARTFASQIALIRAYPEYVFGASQPQHFAFVKEHYPALYQRIKGAVATGHLEPQGGMWVEADCNLISGESMVRQLLHGKNFFKDEFGVEVTNLWLPDVFGYSAALPQILRKSGIRYFLTQKLSWSQFNEFPHTTFIWRGIDGSEVLTHFPPENTYNSQLDTEYLLPAVENFREKGYVDRFMSLFGVGDGGGGPKAENIEMGLRMANLEGAPKVRFGTARSFFNTLETYYSQLPTWVGELYLELHRGTLTSQAQVKKDNRKLEFKLRHIEMLFACVPLSKYPARDLDEIWKKVMLNQFHDILPGSSIHPVYEVTHREYKEAHERCDHLLDNAAQLMFEKSDRAVVVCNTLSCEVVYSQVLPKSWSTSSVTMEGGELLATQVEGDNEEEQHLVALLRLGPGAFATLTRVDGSCEEASTAKGGVLENDVVRYEFGTNGTLVSALHKATGRQVIAPGKEGNVLTLYEDRPNNWDAWDVDLFYENQVIERARGRSMKALSAGPVRQGLQFHLQVGSSKIIQEIWLVQGSTRLDFITTVDWSEKHKMLRVAFPTTVMVNEAAFDIQYGFVKRNTHRNTSWDVARFEVCGHKYADLSEHDFGVALLNDCKYGYKVHDNILDLNLLRSPNYPDPDADQGRHQFTYSLLPHSGDLVTSEVMAQAAALNQPPLYFEGYATGNARFPWWVEGEGLSLEVAKKAEKEDLVILRVVETSGRRTQGRLFVDLKDTQLVATNLLEWEDGVTVACDGSISLDLKPFEILTFKLKQAKGR